MMKGKPHQRFQTSASETLEGFLAGVLDAMQYDDTQFYRYHFGPKSLDGSFVAEEHGRSETLGQMGVSKESMFRILYDPDGDDVTEIICTVEEEREGEPLPERECNLGGDPRSTRTEKVGGEGKIYEQYGGDADESSDGDAEEDEDGSEDEDEYSSSEDDSKSIDLDSEDDLSEDEEDEDEEDEDEEDESSDGDDGDNEGGVEDFTITMDGTAPEDELDDLDDDDDDL